MNELLTSVDRLTKDLKNAAKTLGRDEARFLVDSYYRMQEDRIRAEGQVRSLSKDSKPSEVLQFQCEQSKVLEENARRALDAYSKSSAVGIWSREVIGIGPVIAAGLMAHIDITVADTAGAIWRYGGYDPTVKWEKGQKRPWNASLKRLFWLIGESFVKVSGNPKAVYGHLYLQRKEQEISKNEAGLFAEKAAQAMTERKFGADTEAILWYSGCLTAENSRYIRTLPPDQRLGAVKKLAGKPGSGVPMLSPAHIHARAKRYPVKIFISHWHEVAYIAHFGVNPPAPYPIAILRHAHKLEPHVPINKPLGDESGVG